MLSEQRAYTNSAYNYYINSQSEGKKKCPLNELLDGTTFQDVWGGGGGGGGGGVGG